MPDNNNRKSFSRHFKNTDGSKKDKDIEAIKHPQNAQWIRRMVLEVNKFPFSNSKNISLYSFNREEMEWYYKEIRLLVDKVLDILECPHCGDTITAAVLPGCGCNNPMACCSRCWGLANSICLNCKKHCSSQIFDPVDEIVNECHLFLKEKAFKKEIIKCTDNELKRLSESYFRFLKQSEMQLMCNFCFGTLEKILEVDNESRRQVCDGCHELFMESYTCCIGASPYPTFDKLSYEFHLFFNKMLKFCRKNKSQTYKDPYPDSKQPTYFRRKVLNRKLFKTVKKAVAVAICAYICMYFLH